MPGVVVCPVCRVGNIRLHCTSPTCPWAAQPCPNGCDLAIPRGRRLVLKLMPGPKAKP